MARGEKADPAIRGLALAALDTGASVDSVAKDFKLPISTVKTWNRKRKEERAARKERLGKISSDLSNSALADARRAVSATVAAGLDYDDLMTQYRLLGMEALTKQFELIGNVDYLKRHNPADVAYLHGILFDKQIRLMEAHERGAAAIEGGGDSEDEVDE